MNTRIPGYFECIFDVETRTIWGYTMHLLELVRYKAITDFPTRDNPIISDYLTQLVQNVESTKIPKQTLGIVGVIPKNKVTKAPDYMFFYTMTTRLTSYAALRDVEEIFADFYLRSNVLPDITSFSKRYYYDIKNFPVFTANVIGKQGVLIYGT